MTPHFQWPFVSEDLMQNVNTVCGQNVEILNGRAADKYIAIAIGLRKVLWKLSSA
jgi:hypothetical protein